MKKIILCFILLYSIFLISCSQCPDDRFIGTWSDTTKGEWLSSIKAYDYYSHISYSFNSNDNEFTYYLSVKKYGVSTTSTVVFYKWKQKGDKYYKKNAYNGMSWDDFDLIYIDDSSIQVDGRTLTKE